VEYLLVNYYRRRNVMVKDRVIGYTNDLIEIEGGKYTIKLSPPPNYRPESYEVIIRNTSALNPKVLVFEPTGEPDA